MWRHEIKEQWQDCQKQSPEVQYKKAILKNFAISLANTCVKVAYLQTCNFIKKRTQHRCFPVNIAKFLMLPILKNIHKRMLFNFFNGSLLHEPKGLRSRLYDGTRLQGLVFVFNSTSLILKQVPTCIQKPKANAIDKSVKFLHWLFLVIQMVLGRFRWFQIDLSCIRLFQLVLAHFRSLLTLVSTIIYCILKFQEHLFFRSPFNGCFCQCL